MKIHVPGDDVELEQEQWGPQDGDWEAGELRL